VDFAGKPKPLRNSNDCIATIAVQGLWQERQKQRTQCSAEVADSKEMKHDSSARISGG